MDLNDAILRKSLEAMGITSFEMFTDDEIKKWSGEALVAADASLRKSFGDRCILVLLVSDGLSQSIVTNLNNHENVLSHLERALSQSKGGKTTPAKYTKESFKLPPEPEDN